MLVAQRSETPARFNSSDLQYIAKAAVSSQGFAVVDASVPAGFDHIAAAVF